MKLFFTIARHIGYLFFVLSFALSTSSVYGQNLPGLSPQPSQQGSNANSNPLADLRPIDLPQEPSNWPAPGWWILTLLFCGFVVGLFILWRRYLGSHNYQKRRLQRSALIELNRYDTEHKALFIQQCNALLKRVSIASYPDENPAQLNDQQWIDFLYQHCGSLDSQAFNILKHGPYLPSTELQNSNIAPLKASCEHWLRHHNCGDDNA